MFPELGPVPGNVAIAVCCHVRLPRIVSPIMANGEAIWRHASGDGTPSSILAAERGGKAHLGCRVDLALAGQMLPSHLKQAGSAIRPVNQVQEREHDRTSLFDQ